MNESLPCQLPRSIAGHSLMDGRRRVNQTCRRGSSVLIVLVLLSAMSVILLANSTTLRWLKVEIERVEKQQQQSRGPR